MVKIADCVPILLWDGENIISAVHAGWRGTVKNIVGEAVLKMQSLGADVKNIKAAVGACIHKCCYEVGLDLYETAESLRGDEFCRRYITYNEQGKLFCDLPGMNRELLLCAGIDDANIDICPHCTACEPEEFFSHRATNGIRGTMGAMICLC